MKSAAVAIYAVTCLSWGLDAQVPAEDPFLHWLDHIAQQQLNQRESTLTLIRTAADANRRKQFVREKLSRILGGLPDYAGPLNPRITGSIRNDFYTIERIIFESLPGFYVTGNLYRPNRSGRYPAVLLQAGHTQEGKPEPQIIAANLAIKGFVAFAFDPIGQGEREQTYIRQLGRPLSGGSGNEHIHAGAQSLLLGQSVARYFIWDAKRALDYLITRPDVDSERIGAAGCSGGGALTTYLGALDPRIKVLAPACYINSYRLVFPGPNPDPEMSLPAFLANGLDVADFVELSAPTPWLLLATTEDFFTPDGAEIVYTEARRWFTLYGAKHKVRLFVGQGPHGTPVESREALYEWMTRWLKDGQGDTHDRPVKLYTNHELRVTRTGNVDDEPRSRKVHQLILDEYHARKQHRTIPEMLAELRRLGIPSEGVPPLVKVIEDSDGKDYRLQQIRFNGESGVEISAKLYLPHSKERKPAVLVLEEKRLPVPLHVTRSPSTASLAEAMARSGQVVLELEPRDSPSSYDGRPFLGNWLANERADMIGRNLTAMRAHDILRAVDVLVARSDVDPASISGYARGVKGIWLLLASAVDPRLRKLWLDRTPHSLQSALESPMSINLFDVVIPRFALHWDLQDLVGAMGDRRVLWTDPTNWMDETVSLGPPFRYRYVGEPDDVYREEFLH